MAQIMTNVQLGTGHASVIIYLSNHVLVDLRSQYLDMVRVVVVHGERKQLVRSRANSQWYILSVSLPTSIAHLALCPPTSSCFWLGGLVKVHVYGGE